MVCTKIICTLGPSCDNKTVLRKMMLAGMDVVRINFSHGNVQEWISRVKLVRSLNETYSRRIKILGDLEGFRLRVGKFATGGPIELKKKQIVCLVRKDSVISSSNTIIPLDYSGDLSIVKKDSSIYLDDGNIALKVKMSSAKRIVAEVVVGGLLKERKGLNIPDINIPFSYLTTKDKADILFALENDFDFIAQSFVRSAKDMLILREIIKDFSWKGKLIAKIENRKGFENLESILAVSDGIMVARGDLGVSLPIYQLPILQKLVIRACRRRKKFVITATQMLESMTENIRPTRAEVTDIANAILDGTDFLMLSAETAIGNYPVECVKMMNQIIRYTEDAIRRGVL